MRTELQAKFIQHLNNRKKDDKGFTLVELLVVIIIIGILAAIALPNFLNQGAKAKQSEAKQNVALVNKTQNSYRAENTNFAANFSLLAIGSVTDTVAAGNGTTSNYNYTIRSGTDTASIVAASLDTALKGYSGADNRYTNGSSQSIISTVICEQLQPALGGAEPVIGTAIPSCANATQKNLSL